MNDYFQTGLLLIAIGLSGGALHSLQALTARVARLEQELESLRRSGG